MVTRRAVSAAPSPLLSLSPSQINLPWIESCPKLHNGHLIRSEVHVSCIIIRLIHYITLMFYLLFWILEEERLLSHLVELLVTSTDMFLPKVTIFFGRSKSKWYTWNGSQRRKGLRSRRIDINIEKERQSLHVINISLETLPLLTFLLCSWRETCRTPGKLLQLTLLVLFCLIIIQICLFLADISSIYCCWSWERETPEILGLRDWQHQRKQDHHHHLESNVEQEEEHTAKSSFPGREGNWSKDRLTSRPSLLPAVFISQSRSCEELC